MLFKWINGAQTRAWQEEPSILYLISEKGRHDPVFICISHIQKGLLSRAVWMASKWNVLYDEDEWTCNTPDRWCFIYTIDLYIEILLDSWWHIYDCLLFGREHLIIKISSTVACFLNYGSNLDACTRLLTTASSGSRCLKKSSDQEKKIQRVIRLVIFSGDEEENHRHDRTRWEKNHWGKIVERPNVHV